jgi:hypothetical protein
LIEWERRQFVRPDGGFDPPEIRAGRASALAERQYAPGWMIYSAHMNLAFDISLRAMPELLRFQDPLTGGMFGRLEHVAAGSGIINSAVTSVACEAALATGYVAEACRMGDHLADRVVACNPDLSQALYPIWDTTTGLRADAEAPPGPNMPRVILRRETNQHHYLTGMMIGALTDLYRVTRVTKYLDAARAVFEFVIDGSPDVLRTTLAHKFAWGAAWLFRATQDARCLEAACQVCDYLVEVQESDGSFVHWGLVKSSAEWPFSPRLNITAQFALWISRVAACL